MKLNFTILTIGLLLTQCFSSQAQIGIGNYQSSFKQEGNTFSFTYENAEVQLEFCSNEILRIRTSWSKEFEADEPWMVIKYDWPPVKVEAQEEQNNFAFSTEKLKISIEKAPFSISIADHNGNILSTDKTQTSPKGHYTQGTKVVAQKRLFPDEHFFGFGERMDFLDRRGKKVDLTVGRGIGRPHIIGAYNVLAANYSPIPFFMSTRGYGIFLHNSYETEWDMGSSNNESFSFGAKNGELDYYFMYGPSFSDILDHYTDITGKSPMMPKFGYGLQVGTYSGGTWGHEEMTSTDYVVALARKFRALGIPLDVLHLDSTWRIFGKSGGKGATTFEWRPTFEHPKAMFDSLYAMDLNMVGVHIRPRFDNGNTLNLLDQAREKGFVYPEEDNPGEFVNFFDQKSVDWWWENGAMKVASLEAMFFKTDEGSAFGRKANESDKTGPTSPEAQKLHNVFPIAYAKAPYEKFSEHNGLRGMNMTREGYAGIQRYPYIFAGDWPSEWQYFAPVIKAGLNIGVSGVSNWAHCMGGFEHDADPELYIRWCQFGMFSPVAHLFGMDHPGYKEPWNYGEEALTIFKKFDLLRYSLIPYIYSHSYEAHQTGMPLMRALVLEYQDDINVYEIGDQYMFGANLMICPVTEKGAKTRVVYLPEGTWFDYWTGEQYEGKQYLNVLTPLDQLPIFVKGGAIVPMQKPTQFIGKIPAKEIQVAIYPTEGITSKFSLYDDDGRSLDYREGKFAITEITNTMKSGKVEIDISTPKGDFQIAERGYQLQVHAENTPKMVKVNGKELEKLNDPSTKSKSWYYQANTKSIYIHLGEKNGKAIEVEIQ
ncbi:glycoside hydrolase family 31 protein [Flammeovirgaceae bacterium SG7u.111]|nr:glycoside hydrolase family 31 protein [Flammeovirgaceae bacterium SG7u.132]WPO37607.1 glycoside hydrolase family 31 protein [Flammeovirgaceae bacterium SG7u.111]